MLNRASPDRKSRRVTGILKALLTLNRPSSPTGRLCHSFLLVANPSLDAIDVKTGAEKMLAPLDLPASTDGVAGFSLHPEGNPFLTPIAKWPYDIWMLEGFDQMPRKTWLDRLLRSLDSTPSPGTW